MSFTREYVKPRSIKGFTEGAGSRWCPLAHTQVGSETPRTPRTPARPPVRPCPAPSRACSLHIHLHSNTTRILHSAPHLPLAPLSKRRSTAGLAGCCCSLSLIHGGLHCLPPLSRSRSPTLRSQQKHATWPQQKKRTRRAPKHPLLLSASLPLSLKFCLCFSSHPSSKKQRSAYLRPSGLFLMKSCSHFEVTDLGRSSGRLSARSQKSCARTPKARPTPKRTV